MTHLRQREATAGEVPPTVQPAPRSARLVHSSTKIDDLHRARLDPPQFQRGRRQEY